jgi:ribosome-binding ATPase YchF (GTP1/OBG family)
MSKNDSDKDGIVAFNNELLRKAIEILKKEIEKLTQDSPDPMLRAKNAKELVQLFDDVFGQIKELKSDLIHIKLENERLKEFLSKQRNDPANTNSIPL